MIRVQKQRATMEDKKMFDKINSVRLHEITLQQNVLKAFSEIELHFYFHIVSVNF
jgi:hypothetical protein